MKTKTFSEKGYMRRAYSSGRKECVSKELLLEKDCKTAKNITWSLIAIDENLVSKDCFVVLGLPKGQGTGGHDV